MLVYDIIKNCDIAQAICIYLDDWASKDELMERDKTIAAIYYFWKMMKDIAGQIQSGNFTLANDSYEELKRDYFALAVTVVDIVNGAAYLFEKEITPHQRNWKAELELEQYRSILKLENCENKKEKRDTD